MPNVRNYRRVGHEQLDAARITGTVRQAIPASAAATFACLEDGEAWPVWLDPVKSVTWTSPKPFGVGTTRDITLGPTRRPAVISEEFYLWEDGVVMGFFFASGALPVFDAFAEEWRVTPTGADSCELEWRYGIDLAGPLKYVSSLAAKRFGRDGQKSLGQLADFMAAHKTEYRPE